MYSVFQNIIQGPYTCERCGICFELANTMACHNAFVCTPPPKRQKSPPPISIPTKQKRTCNSNESIDDITEFAFPPTASAAHSESLLSPQSDSKLAPDGGTWEDSGEPASAASQPEALTLILGLYKSANPVVDSVLRSVAGQCPQAPASNSLAASIAAPATAPPGAHIRNWCARCGAVFRMTGDLVHHIRGHHRQDALDATAALSTEDDSPPSPKQMSKREQMHPLLGNSPREETSRLLLRCNICGERFRERHHLSRHLSSH